MYYRGPIEVGPLEQIGWDGRGYRPFEWGQVMYGGAVFDLDGRHFDIHYRNLDAVDHWTREAEQGRFAGPHPRITRTKRQPAQRPSSSRWTS